MIEKIANRRENFRSQIREAFKQNILREKRAALIEAAEEELQLNSYQSER